MIRIEQGGGEVFARKGKSRASQPTWNCEKIHSIAVSMRGKVAMLEDLIGVKVVIDLRSEYVCLGKLIRFDDHFIAVEDADLHDLRDTDTTRENYVASSVITGIKRNRRHLLVTRREIVAISRLSDVVDE